MKGIFKIVSIVILLGALVGASVLVKRNQETRRGAAANDTSMQILPDIQSVDPGEAFGAVVWVNTGKDTDKLLGAELKIHYDKSVMQYDSFDIINGYSVLNEDTADDGNGLLTFKVITIGTEKAGAVELGKVRFTAKSGSGKIYSTEGRLKISGQQGMWDIASFSNSTINVGGATVTEEPPILSLDCRWCGLNCEPYADDKACTMVEPPEGKSCVTENDKCVIKTVAEPTCLPLPPCAYVPSGPVCDLDPGVRYCPKPTPNVDPPPACNKRCTSNAACGSGLICAPIWWPCAGSLSASLNLKLQQNAALGKAVVAEMIRVCPKVVTKLPTDYQTRTTITMPTFYGVCRNPKCIPRTSCICSTGVTPTMGPQCSPILCTDDEVSYCPPSANGCANGCGFQCAKPTPSENRQVMLSLIPEKSSVQVGEEFWVDFEVDAGTGKVSVVKVKIDSTGEGASLKEVVADNGGEEQMKKIDPETGSVTLYYTWSMSSNELKSKFNVARLRFVAEKSGLVTLSLDKYFAMEIAGVDENGKSISYTLSGSGPISINIEDGGGTVCKECSSGPAKSTGNANCDEAVNGADFEIWRSEVFDQDGLSGKESSDWQADFDCNKTVSGSDFETWRSTVFQ